LRTIQCEEEHGEGCACYVPDLYRKVSAFTVNSRDKTQKDGASSLMEKPAERAGVECEHL